MGTQPRTNRYYWQPYVLAATLLVLAGCGGTPQAKTETGAVIVKELGKVALATCKDSKANSWVPLTQANCNSISVAYSTAWDGAKRAVRIQRAGGKVDVATIMEIAWFVLDTVAILQEAGVDIPENVLVYAEGVRGVLK